MAHCLRRAWLALALLAAAGGTSAAGQPTLSDASADLEYGQKAGTATLILLLSGLDASEMAAPQLITAIADKGTGSETVAVDKDVDVRELTPAGTSSRSYLVTLHIQGLEIGSKRTRWLQLTAGGKDALLQYTISNVPEAAFSWKVAPQAAVRVSPGQAIAVTVINGPLPATGIRVISSSVAEKGTKASLAPEGLYVCASSTQDCAGAAPSLPPSASAELWLWGAEGVGAFEGTVLIAADGKPGGDSVALTVYSSTAGLKTLGVLVILASVIATWVATQFVRSRINRTLLMIPIAGLQRQLQRMNAIASADPSMPLPLVLAKIADLFAGLNEPTLLSNGLPPSVPWASAPSGAGTLASLDQHLKPIGEWVSAITVLLKEGLVPLRELGAAPPHRGDVPVALRALDDLASAASPPTLDAVRAQIRVVLTKMQTDFAATDGARGMPGARAEMPESPESLTVTVERLSLVSWALTLLATTLAGSYVLVLGPDSLGFGTELDFLKCVLWGIGLPAGAQLMQQTSSSTQTTLALPKF